MNGTTPQATTRQQETNLCSMSVWENGKKTLEGQGRQLECNKNGNTAWSDCVSESNSPGLIAQLKGKLTQQQIKYATVFINQYSGYTFIYLQKRLTSEETVQAKHAFERSADQCGVKILHYHVDNGQFADNAFIYDCKAQSQSLSYCRVDAHFQNSIAERHIRDLQEQTRTSMLYAMNKWKRMILICLWPYAMRHANDVANATPKKGEDSSPLEKFSGVKVVPKLRHFHAFGCPTYILDNALQSGQSAPKWRQHSRLGVYLGPSPNHARLVALVLNPRTGHVSPQFHVKFDDFFKTVQKKPTDLDAIQKGQPKPSANRPLGDLIAPRRGPTTSIPPNLPPAEPTTQQPTSPIPRYRPLHHYQHNQRLHKRHRPATHARHAADES